MHYYIDGYNLLFRLLRAADDLQAQREKIIRDLSGKVAFLKLDATLVFDAHYQVGESAKSHFQDLEVLFTSEGVTADDFIINELKSIADPRQETVVTSDKKLAWRARRKAAHAESVEEFMGWLTRRYKNRIKQQRGERVSLSVQAPFPPPVKKTNLPPAKAVSPEECMSYYEEVFEKEYRQIASKRLPFPDITPDTPAEELLGKKQNQAKEEVARTEMERWLDLFERKEQKERENGEL